MQNIDDTYNIFIKAMGNNEYSYDIYFRMAVIEGYLNGNSEVWNLYNKMQQTRCKQIKQVPAKMANHQKEFIDLINSIQLKGYDFNFPLLINKEGLIIDGAHRMACSLYFDIPKIAIYTNEEYFDFIPADYSKKWFENNKLYECIKLAEIQREKEKIKCINRRKF